MPFNLVLLEPPLIQCRETVQIDIDKMQREHDVGKTAKRKVGLPVVAVNHVRPKLVESRQSVHQDSIASTHDATFGCGNRKPRTPPACRRIVDKLTGPAFVALLVPEHQDPGIHTQFSECLFHLTGELAKPATYLAGILVCHQQHSQFLH